MLGEPTIDRLGLGTVIDQVVDGFSEGFIITSVFDPAPNDVRTAALAANSIPPGARIESADFRVTVDPPGLARIEDVAEVRSTAPPLGSGASFVIDFGTLVTLSGLNLDFATNVWGLTQWMGTSFANTSFFPLQAMSLTDPPVPELSFGEVMTERIRIDISDTTATTADILRGEVVIPTPPPSAELVVNGERVWFNPIDATAPRSFADSNTQHALAASVDLAADLQRAIDTSDEATIELRTSGPAVMSINAPTLRFLRTHAVDFSDGIARTIRADQEGLYTLDLPLDGSPGADDWDVRAVELRVLGEPTSPRVLPPVGPVLADDIELVLEGERTLLMALPAEVVGRYASVEALRLPLRAGPGGGEIAGQLLAHNDDIDGPGDPLPDATLAPLPLEPSEEFAFVTVAFDTPFEPTGEDVWVELRSARGEIAWALAEAAAVGDLPATRLRWRAPSGVARPLSTVAEVVDLRGAVRLVGVADPNRPIDVLEVGAPTRDESTLVTPIAAGTPLTLTFDGDGVSPAKQGVSDLLRIDLTTTAPGDFTFDSAVVVYRDPAIDGAST